MELTVIGIDPGSRLTGWGVISERSGVLRLVECGVIRTPSGAETAFSARLARIYLDLAAVVARHAPSEAAMEQIFTAKNVASAIKLGQARGAAAAACASGGVPVSDYEPTLVKQTLVGTGRADKSQVAFMARRLLGIRDGQWNPAWTQDVSDALAVGICHLTLRRFRALEGGRRRGA